MADENVVGRTKAAEKGDMVTESCVDDNEAMGTGSRDEVLAGDSGTDEVERR